jgi:hypothetical protein
MTAPGAAPVRVLLEIDLPEDMAGLMLPEGVDRRLHALLDKQAQGEPLTEDEVAEAEGLVDLADLLSLIRLRASGQGSTTPTP